MSVVPDKQVEKIEFFENHIAPWNTNAVAIGTTAAAVSDLDTKTDAARAALTAAQQAKDAAKAATLNLQVAIDAMDTAGGAIIKQIRAKAEMSGDGVYVLAQIPAPATPTPVGAPGTPNEFDVQLDGDGSVILTWKCANPAGAAGTMYQIYRSTTGSDGEFSYLGGCGEKKFVDATFPAGATAVTYKIQAVRSTAVGLWATFNVLFGTNAGTGAMTASVQSAPKIAA